MHYPHNGNSMASSLSQVGRLTETACSCCSLDTSQASWPSSMPNQLCRHAGDRPHLQMSVCIVATLSHSALWRQPGPAQLPAFCSLMGQCSGNKALGSERRGRITKGRKSSGFCHAVKKCGSRYWRGGRASWSPWLMLQPWNRPSRRGKLPTRGVYSITWTCSAGGPCLIRCSS